MNDLISKTVEFLFVPETALAVFFLALFIALFTLGVYWAQNCRSALENLRENAVSEYAPVQSKMSPELFIKKYLNKISADESKLGTIPEMLVSIGIVATFLGLGVAIQGSAELLEDEKLELAKLTAVLGVIAFKFQTSVWGICFSLIFRAAVLNHYLNFKQETLELVSNSLYAAERQSIQTLLEQQNKILSGQYAFQTKISEERTNQYKNLLAENQRNFNSLFEIIGETNNALTTLHADNIAAFEELEYIQKHFNKFITTAEFFAVTAKDFSKCVEQFKVELSENLQTIFKEIENLSALQKENMDEIHSQHERNIFHVTEKLDELHQKFYLDSKRYVEETQRNLDNLLAKTLDNVNDGYIREAAEIRNVINSLNETLANLERHTNYVNEEFISRQNQFVNEWRNITESVTSTMQTVEKNFTANSQYVAESYKNLNNAVSTIENRTNQVTKELINLQNKFTDEWRSITDSVANTLQTVKKTFAANSERATEIYQKLSNVVETIQNATPDKKPKESTAAPPFQPPKINTVRPENWRKDRN